MVTSDADEFSTVPEPTAQELASVSLADELGLVVLACPEAPQRVGAFLPVPAGERPWILGRGLPRSEDEHPRLQAALQRPGVNVTLPPFESASLSRSQLLVSASGEALDLTNVGKCSLAVNGSTVRRASVFVGDVVEVGRQLTLLCAARPRLMPGERAAVSHVYGEPDEFGLVGESAPIARLREEIRFVSARGGHVLIVGESGTGKELVAAAIHVRSRSGKPWITRNATTIPDTLIDAELFGTAKNYPNVGAPERKGLIGAADEGTLFLDEFAELPPLAQTHLLRVLDAGEYQRLGETAARYADFRLVAATNRSPAALRADMLSRFSFRIELPSLAQRREDIPLLVRHWLRVFAQEDPSLAHRFFGAEGEPLLSTEFIARLVARPLEGNVRELRNLLWQLIATSDRGALTLPAIANPSSAEKDGSEPDLTAVQLQRALEANEGSLEKTWRVLGLSNRFALMRLMKKFGVQVRKLPRRA